MNKTITCKSCGVSWDIETPGHHKAKAIIDEYDGFRCPSCAHVAVKNWLRFLQRLLAISRQCGDRKRFHWFFRNLMDYRAEWKWTL